MQEQYIIALVKIGMIIGIGVAVYLFVYFLLFKSKGFQPPKITLFWGLLIGLVGVRFFLFFGIEKLVIKSLDFVILLMASCIIIRIFDFYLIEMKIEMGRINFPLSWHKVILRIVYGILALMNALLIWRYDFLPWFILLGIITIVSVLAFQDLLKSAINGLQWGKIFRIGNWVSIGNKEGKIVELTWQGVKLQTEESNYLFIPSAVFSKETIINYSVPEQKHRCHIDIKADYSVAPDKIKQILRQVVSGIQGVIVSPLPQVIICSFDDFYITYRLQFFIDNYSERQKMKSKIYNLIWYQFKRNDIEIPRPVYNVYDYAISADEELRKKQKDILFKKGIIKKISFLSVFSDENLTKIAERSKRQRFLKGEKIIQQGQKDDVLFIILSGKILLNHKKKGLGKEIRTTHLEPGQFFGEMSLFIGEESFSTVIVEETGECVVLKRDDLRDILLTDISVVQPISRILGEKQTHQKVRIEEELDKEETIITIEQRIKNIFLKINEVFRIIKKEG